MPDRGFVWFAFNKGDVDYIELSARLARSIKKNNIHNSVCVITDKKIDNHGVFDFVVTMKNPRQHPFSNEHMIAKLSPFTHTIKLEADMLLTSSIDWWWNYLCQHDLVLSKDCFDFRGNVVKDVAYRQLFESNKLPNVYNALTYFRKSQWATEFYKYCELVTNNWSAIKEHCLTACDTEFPNTDEIYALAYKMLDPLDEKFVEYDWFKFTHNKNLINGIRHSVDNQQYLYPMEMNDRLYVGAYRQQGVWHYHNKKTMEEIDARIF